MAELICPKCGGYAEVLADTCPRCRVVVSKYQAYLQQSLGKGAGTPNAPQAGALKSRKKASWLDQIKKHLRRVKR